MSENNVHSKQSDDIINEIDNINRERRKRIRILIFAIVVCILFAVGVYIFFTQSGTTGGGSHIIIKPETTILNVDISESKLELGVNVNTLKASKTMWFPFTAPSSGTYIFEIKDHYDYGNNSSGHTDFNLYFSSSMPTVDAPYNNNSQQTTVEHYVKTNETVYIGIQTRKDRYEVLYLIVSKKTATPTSTTAPGISSVSIGNNWITLSAGQNLRVKFSAPSKGTYIFTTTGSDDTVGALYNTATSDSSLDSNDDAGNGNKNFRLERSMNINATIYIEVRYYEPSKSGTIVLNISKKTESPTSTPKKASQNTPSPQFSQPVDIGVPNLQGRSFSRIYSSPHSTYDMNIYVYWVQVQLKQLGYYHDDLTGLFDRTTNSSISSFMNSQNKTYSNSINQNVINAINDAVGTRRIAVKYGGYYHAMDYLTLDTQGTGNMSIIWSNINHDKYGPNPNTPHEKGGAYWVQYCLTHLGYNPKGIDGKFGEGTDLAVQRFESDNGFTRKADRHVYVTYGEARRMIEMCYARGIDIDIDNMDWGD